MTGAGDTTAFDEAARRVAAGADPRAEAAALREALSDEERLWCLDGDLPFWAGLADLGSGGYHRRPFPAARIERLGIPGFTFSDGPRGCVIGPATCYPVSMARGATWDPDLEERIGDAIGAELRHVGATLFGGVCVNVLRHPAWGRAQETYGEDPFLVGEMGAALTRGAQRHVMACVKHYACNSMENARFKVDVEADEVALHDVYLPHFRRIVDEGAAVVMSAYNAVNGEWCGQSRHLLTDVLRDEWGFEGFVISDWIFGLRDPGPSVAAGLDVEMPYRMMRASGLEEALERGECTRADVDAAVDRILATLLRFEDRRRAEPPPADVLACERHRALAREAASRSMVLLRNEEVDGIPVLPLERRSLRRVAVVGRLAALRNLGDGGSSDVHAPDVVTHLQGLREALPDAEVLFHDGDDPAEAAALAASADAAVVVVGYTRDDEGEYIDLEGTAHLGHLMPGPDDPELAAAFEEAVRADPGPEPPPELREGDQGFASGGDRRSLSLHPHDEALIRSVGAAAPRAVVAVVAGSAVVLDGWLGSVPAVVQAWYSGMEGGRALAALLLGDAEPSGRLPFSVASAPEHLPSFDPDADAAAYDGWHGWWHLERIGVPPAFPFGFGLAYTDLALTGATVTDGPGGVHVRARVENRGPRPGTDVVQVYARRPELDDLTPRSRRLVGFARVELEPGEHREVAIEVPAHRFERRDPDRGGWVVDPGPYEISVARHAADADAHRSTVRLDLSRAEVDRAV